MDYCTACSATTDLHTYANRPYANIPITTDGGAMDLDAVLAFDIPEKTHRYTTRDTILYALGVGLGADPLDKDQLRHVYEEHLEALPTFSLVLAHPGFWINDPRLQLDWVNALHTEQFMSVSGPLPVQGEVKASYRITGISDRGPERGATLYFEKRLSELDSGREIARITTGLLCRKDGGCGDHGELPPPLERVPQTLPDDSLNWHISPTAALLCRLSGDLNPLHADPDVARRAGFERPILHGLCTLGIAAQNLARWGRARQGGELTSIACRFTKPVYPGDDIVIDLWSGADAVQFEVRNAATNVVVIGSGSAVFS